MSEHVHNRDQDDETDLYLDCVAVGDHRVIDQVLWQTYNKT